MTRKHFHVLWAVDVAYGHKEIQMKTAQSLRVLLAGLDAEVEPVTVFSPDQIKIPADAFQEHTANRRLEIEMTLEEWSTEAGFSNTLKPRLLVQHEFSLRRSSVSLLDYAKDVGANLIALGTSAKSGIKRAVLGSFAESIALHSETPLFIVNPTTHPVTEIREILFPTDFSDSCRKAFDKVLPIAAAKGAKITLFYKLEYIVPETADMIATYPPYKTYMAQDVEQKRKRAEEWQAAAAREGVVVEVVFNEAPAYVVDSILGAAGAMKDGMIAMASQRGGEAFLLGSITRDLIRRCPHPVWVIHPH